MMPNDDGSDLERLAKRVTRFSQLMRFYTRNYERESQAIAFWTERRERGFFWLMQVFERDWCYLRDAYREHPRGQISILWKEIEALAPVIGDFAMQHDWQVTAKDLPPVAQIAMAALTPTGLRN